MSHRIVALDRAQFNLLHVAILFARATTGSPSTACRANTRQKSCPRWIDMAVKRRMVMLGYTQARLGRKGNLSTYLTKLNSGTAPATPWKSIVSLEKSGSWLLRWTAVLSFHSPPLFFPPLGI